MTGYLWSDTIGWVDLNCINEGDCSPSFGITIAADGTLAGYAWSEHVGWVSANATDLAGCPSGTCRATLGTTALTGWLRVIAGGTSQSGGWDGFIALSGVSPAYGVTYNSSGVFGGYAWGDINVGWVDFSRARSTYNTCAASYVCSGQTIMQQDVSCNQTPVTTCTAPAFCSAGSSTCLYPVTGPNGPNGNLRAVPSFVRSGATSRVYWDVINAASCQVVGSNGDGGGGWNALSSGPTGIVTGPITDWTTYTLTCMPLNPSAQPFVQTATVSIPPVFYEL